MSRLPRKRATRLKRFIDSYAVSLNATKAAIDAGYSENGAGVRGHTLLKNSNVQALVAERLNELGITKERTLRELSFIAYSRQGDLYDEFGKLKPIHTLPEHVQASIASVEVVRGNLDRGDGAFDEVHKVKQWDKTKALEMAGKYLKLFDGDKGDTNVQIVVSWQTAPGQTSEPINVTPLDTTSRSGLLPDNVAVGGKSNGINKS